MVRTGPGDGLMDPPDQLRSESATRGGRHSGKLDLGVMNKACREDQVQFGDVLKGTEMDQEFGSFALGTTGQAKAMDTRRAAQVGLLVGDATDIERTGYKFGNMRIEPSTHQAILYPAGGYRAGRQQQQEGA
jgi:hypothetical protein